MNGVWKAVKPWLDPVTAAKVTFIPKGALPEYIPSQTLMEEYGGADTYKVILSSRFIIFWLSPLAVRCCLFPLFFLGVICLDSVGAIYAYTAV